MNKKEYQDMMNSIKPDPKIRNTIYQNINQKSSVKRFYPKLALVCVAFVLVFSLIQTSNKTTVNPFVIEVQAKDGIEEVSSDAKMLLTVQNKTFYQENGEKCTFKKLSQEGENSFSKLYLTLPIQIQGEDIQKISFEVNNPNGVLIPRFSLENYIIGENDDEIGEAMLKYHQSTSDENRYYDRYKVYSEMSEEGKKIFKEYVNLYKEEIVNGISWKAWGNTEEDLYNDEYSEHVLWNIRYFSLQKYDSEDLHNHPEKDEYQFLRKLRIDEDKYFRWGREEDTKVATYDYHRFKKDDVNMQLAIYNPDDLASTSEMLNELEKTTVTIKVFYTDATMSQKTISFQDMNEKTGTYTLVIE